MKLKKTYLQAFAEGCPKQFADIYIYRKYQLESTPEMQAGQRFHEFACRFFDLVKWNELKPLKTLEDISTYMRLFMPKEIEQESVKTGMLNFCDFEAKHYMAVKDLGEQYFFPLDKEFEISTPTIDCHIDRIDLLNINNCVCPLEYKMMRSWNDWTYRYVRRELVFYAIALNAVPKYRERAHYIAAYNPLLNKFLFESIHRNTIAAVIRWIYRLKEAVDKQDFPRRPDIHCVRCPSAAECFLADDRVPEPIV